MTASVLASGAKKNHAPPGAKAAGGGTKAKTTGETTVSHSMDIKRVTIGEVNISNCGGNSGSGGSGDNGDNGSDTGGGSVGFVPPILILPTIRDNKWKIKPGYGIVEVCSFDFTPKEVKISDQQPCNVVVGTTYHSQGNTMIFEFGRHHTDDVWWWWWGKLGGSWDHTCNTIWSDDKDHWGINFATLGDLTVFYRKVMLGEIFSHTMTDVVVGQWNYGAINRWNFGGVNWTRENTLTCQNNTSSSAQQLNENGHSFFMTENTSGVALDHDYTFFFCDRG
jgi:hypothetical protein